LNSVHGGLWRARRARAYIYTFIRPKTELDKQNKQRQTAELRTRPK
jgi:hypothetical protein